jgi:hypothetical protein
MTYVVRIKKPVRPERFGWDDEDTVFKLTTKSGRWLVKTRYNPNHKPSGGNEGGRFTSAGDMDPGVDTPDETAEVLFEVAPDPNDTELTERWNALSDKAKFRISKLIAKGILPGVLELLGTGQGKIIELIGGYLGATNPSLALELSDPKLALAASGLLGHALRQDSMIVLSPEKAPGLSKVGVVGVDLPPGQRSIGSVRKIYDNLYQIKGKDGQSLVTGFNLIGNRMEILNFPGDDGKLAVTNSRLAQLVDKQLGGTYDVSHTNAYSAFVDKKDYAHAGRSVEGSAAAWRQSADRLRAQASEALEKQLGG